MRIAPFVVSLEVRASAVSRLADVVLPVAPAAEKAGSFVNWEGRIRSFDNIFRLPTSLPDLRVLAGIAEEMGVELGFRTVDQVRAQMTELGPWDGARASAPAVAPDAPGAASGPDEAVLATWKLLIDDGRMLDGEEYLKATGRRAVALLSPDTLAGLGLEEGQLLTITGDRGAVTLPVSVADLPNDVVWAPASSGGISIPRDLGALAGSVVRLVGGAA